MPERTKIAILGGGMGSLTAAYELTSHSSWRDRFEVTVYQPGWRLGGKGASGRNRRAQDRIEEHGLHLWMGFYENAFSLIRRCYGELGRPPGAPLATWREAFEPSHTGGVGEMVGGRWTVWLDQFRPNGRVPGDGHELFTIGDTLVELAEMVLLGVTILLGPPGVFRKAIEDLGSALAHLAEDASGRIRGAGELYGAFGDWRRLVRNAPDRLLEIAGRLRGLMDALWARVEPAVRERDSIRHIFIIVDIVAACARGVILDGVLFDGFGAIEHWDFRSWIRRHGARSLSYESPLVRGTYDLFFADGPGSTLAAGTALRFMTRMVLDYRHAIFWKMQAGMGDVVFAPMYEVLARRGVRFEFFHAVRRLRLAPGANTIEGIDVDRQVRLRPGATEYRPLYDVKGLPCWPSEPLYEQIEDGARLEEGWATKNYNLESWWSAWPAAERRTLERGRDFDVVVLGIPLGALPPIAGELIERDAAWRRMVDQIPTTATIAMQLWLRPGLADLGWRGPPTVIDAYAEPFSTWADMSHLIEREAWPASPDRPRTLAYLCGRGWDAGPLPGPEAHDFPAEQAARVRREAARWLGRHVGPLWPAATRSDDPGALEWRALVDPEDREGDGRLDAHYFRINLDPSERFVLSPAGTAESRLRPDQSGFGNLYLAGDWTRTGLDIGCIEAAVMSGMQASRAIAGYPQRVFGERDLTLPRLRPGR